MKKLFLGLIIIILLVPACSGSTTPTPAEQPTVVTEATSTPRPQPTATPAPPTATPTPAPSPTPTEPPIEVIQDVEYVPDGDALQTLDIYLPQDAEGPLPTLLLFHGSGGDKVDMASLAQHFVALDYAAISVGHRSGYSEDVQDVFCALAWAQANAATYGLDPERFAALGYTHGANMAAMLGVVDDPTPYMENCPHTLPETYQVLGVVGYAGWYDVKAEADYAAENAAGRFFVDYVGVEYSEDPERWAAVSPQSYVDGNEPPFLLIHGGRNVFFPPWLSSRFSTALGQAGVEVERIQTPDYAVDCNFSRGECRRLTEAGWETLPEVEAFLAGLFE